MTLREIQAILTTVPLERAMLNQPGAQTVGNLTRFKQALHQLSAIPQFQQSVLELQQSPLYSTGADDISTPQAQALKQKADALILGALGLEHALAETLPQIPKESILVRLPPDQTLSNVADLLEELQKILGQLVTLENIEGGVEIASWETGSLLVFLYLKSLAAVDLVGRALRAGALIYQEIQKGRLIGQHVRLLKVRVESAQDVQKAQEKLLKELVEQQARKVETDTFTEHKPERLERLKLCVRGLAELLDKGTTVYPALEMPKESKDKFPDLDHIHALLSEMKQLEDAIPSDAEGAAPSEGGSEQEST